MFPGTIKLLSLANAGNYWWKRDEFYPFKDRFLRRHGEFDGWDRQVIKHDCWSCHGTGEWKPCLYHDFYSCYDKDEDCLGSQQCVRSERCFKCGGAGIHSTRTYYLERYRLGRRVFHIPGRMPENEPPTALFVRTLEGRVTHPHVNAKRARTAALLLFLLYEPGTFVRALYLWQRARQLWWRATAPVRKVRWKFGETFSENMEEPF